MHVHPQRPLKNVNISAGVRKIGEKEMMPEKERQGATETEEDRSSQFSLTNLAEFIFYFISGGSRLPW